MFKVVTNPGHELTAFMVSVAKKQGFKKFKVHAQSYLKDFYQKHGFEIVGDILCNPCVFSYVPTLSLLPFEQTGLTTALFW